MKTALLILAVVCCALSSAIAEELVKPLEVRKVFANGKLTPYCELPSGGDCAYLEAVEDGETMLVSYYSTHEGSTNIYLAVVPLMR